jgi:hypothetical protein
MMELADGAREPDDLYTAASLAISAGLPFWLTIAVGGLAAGISSLLLIPIGRLKGYNPHGPWHLRMRAFDRELIRGGHYGRANRPNTRPLRPTPQSEDSTCQPGAVHTWSQADIGRAALVDMMVSREVRGLRATGAPLGTAAPLLRILPHCLPKPCGQRLKHWPLCRA